MGDPDGSSTHADEDVHPVMVHPQVPDLHPMEVGWLAQGAYYVFADHGVHLLMPLLIGIRMLHILLLRWHRLFPNRDWEVQSGIRRPGQAGRPSSASGLHRWLHRR